MAQREGARVGRLLAAAVASAVLSSSLIFVSRVAAVPLQPIPRGDIAIQLNPIATGMSAPLFGLNAPGDPNRLFVLEQNGLVRIIQNGVLQPGVALDMQPRIAPPLNPANANDERGLLGMTFHPGFNNPSSPGFRTLYTYNSEPIGTGATYNAPLVATQAYKNVINEWKVDPSNPNVIDPASRREVISFGKDAGNHNGGTVAYGPDGYLYLALGDGGNANDVGPSHLPAGNGQDLSTPLGKMIRIDPVHPSLTSTSTDPVSANGQYRIPQSNPSSINQQVPEIYAMGFRNPYRFAFDRGTGKLILADVGQRTIEEVNEVISGGNYGWPIKEGTFTFDRASGNVIANSPGAPAGLIDPIQGTQDFVQYDHGDGISITGGFVYRGTEIPELVGKYVFGDLALRNLPPRVDGRLFYADLTTGLIREFQMPEFANGVLPNGLTVHGFGQDFNGELYAMVTNTPANGNGGIVYKIERFVPEPGAAMLGVLALAPGFARRRR